MAKKKSTSRKRAAPVEPEGPEIPWARIGAVAAVLLGVAIVAGGIGLADRRAGDLLGAETPVVRFNWAEAVSAHGHEVWPPQAVQLRLDDEAHAIVDREGGPLSVRALESLGTWIDATGWVETVRSIERSAAGVITIDVAWRSPAGVVRQRDRDWLISTDGRRLNAQWSEGGAGMPVVMGAQGMTPAGSVLVGDRWPDLPVLAGVELLTLLSRELGLDPILGSAGFDQVVGVDVSEYERYQRLVILTDAGNRIIWGRAPSDPVSDPVPTAKKLEKLEYMRRHPDYGMRIDAGQALIDISTGPVLIDAPRGVARPGRR